MMYTVNLVEKRKDVIASQDNPDEISKFTHEVYILTIKNSKL